MMNQPDCSMSLAVSAATCELHHNAPDYALLDSQGGVLRCSAAARPWFSGHRLSALQIMAQAAETEGADTWLLEDFQVRFVRLAGGPRSEYLAVFTPVGAEPRPTLPPLSQAQLRVAELAAAGFRVVEVAALLKISTNTVKFHLKKVYARWNVRNRAELTAALELLGLRQSEQSPELTVTEVTTSVSMAARHSAGGFNVTVTSGLDIQQFEATSA